jgi:hypothetical protein
MERIVLRALRVVVVSDRKEESTVERPFHPTRAAARVLLWLGGVLTGVALVQGAAFPLGVAFFGSIAALHVLRSYDTILESAAAPAAEPPAPAPERRAALLS